MDTATWIEIIGYAGSALVLVSFLMSSVVKLRIVNTIGSLIFAVYALIIKSYPTAILNICLVCINRPGSQYISIFCTNKTSLCYKLRIQNFFISI